jgi:CDP-4-dehydro-6-deoxyglucose reductase
MPHVVLEKERYALHENETVLDGLLRNGQEIAHACRSGVCQACLVKSLNSSPSAKAVAGLKPGLRSAGYAMACQWVPDRDIEITLPGEDDISMPVCIASLQRISDTVMQVLLRPENPGSMAECRPGQYITLTNALGVSRSYSIANDVRQDGVLELHVAATPQGQFSSWLFQAAQPGDMLRARGPAGDCFYAVEGERDYPLLLVGTATGLAPLYGILKEALSQGHTGSITLLHGGSTAQRLYFVDEMHALMHKHSNVAYEALVLHSGQGDERIRQGNIEQAALSRLVPALLAQTRVYLCGAPEFVTVLRKKIFLQGVRSANIFCDAFVMRPAP